MCILYASAVERTLILQYLLLVHLSQFIVLVLQLSQYLLFTFSESTLGITILSIEQRVLLSLVNESKCSRMSYALSPNFSGRFNADRE